MKNYTFEDAKRRLITVDGGVYMKDDLGNWRELYGDILPEDALEVQGGNRVAWNYLMSDENVSLSSPINNFNL